MVDRHSHDEASSLWYLVPFFFSILGGIIAYVAIKDDDPAKAESCLGLGFIMFIINFVLIMMVMW